MTEILRPYTLFIITLCLLAFSCSDSGAKQSSGCQVSPSSVKNKGLQQFIQRDAELGMATLHGYTLETWGNAEFSEPYAQEVMEAGGVTAAYLNEDCWPDLLITSGDAKGMVLLENKGKHKGFIDKSENLSGTYPAEAYKWVTGASIADIDGDYKEEIILGSLRGGDVVILSQLTEENLFFEKLRIPTNASIYGISFGDSNNNGFLDMFFGHWEIKDITELPWPNLFWLNEGGLSFTPADYKIPETPKRHFFTPIFADIRDSGYQDILLAADYGTSTVLQNNGDGSYRDVTDRDVITDRNGMGAALGDIDNDGKLDWFVTAITDAPAHGNRLYKNNSTRDDIIFTNITESAGIRDGEWAWAACMADFNNDGFLDIYHVNGWGYFPYNPAFESFEWIGTPPRLFINQGNGTFIEQAENWGINIPSEGRGISCFDSDRDGDIDIAVLDHTTGLQYFENQLGHKKGNRFANIRLIGNAPNTQAVGAKVILTVDLKTEFGLQKQTRLVQANSNFNSQNLADLHFGLADADQITELLIKWPDNTGLICTSLPVNQFLVFDQREQLATGPTQGKGVCQFMNDISLLL